MSLTPYVFLLKKKGEGIHYIERIEMGKHAMNESSKLSTHDSNDLRIRDDRLLSYLSLNFRLLNKKA